MDSPTISEKPAGSTLERLLDVAALLFRENGFAGTRTRELAALAGIQNASLYHHIRSKTDLLYRLSVESLERITAELETAVAEATDPEDRLRRLIVTHMVTSLTDQNRHATMLTELRALPDAESKEVIALRDLYEARVANVISQAQKAGVVRADVPARSLTLALLNLLNWTIFWYQPGGDLDPRELGELYANLFLEGALASPRRSGPGEAP